MSNALYGALWRPVTANPAKVTWTPIADRPLCRSCGADYLSPLEWDGCPDCVEPDDEEPSA